GRGFTFGSPGPASSSDGKVGDPISFSAKITPNCYSRVTASQQTGKTRKGSIFPFTVQSRKKIEPGTSRIPTSTHPSSPSPPPPATGRIHREPPLPGPDAN